MIYLQLFLSYLKIGFFGFGGGYAMLSLIQNEIVTRHAWLSSSQLADIVAVSQMTPGPIAVNCATYVGYSVTGTALGSILATFAVCLPPLTIMMAIVLFYNKVQNSRAMKGAISWMKPVMCGMIGAAALSFANPETFVDFKSFGIFIVCTAALFCKVDSMLLIALSALAGILLY